VKRSVYKVLVVKPEGKRPHGRHRRKWEDNVKMDFQNVRCGSLTGSMCVMMAEVAGTSQYIDEQPGSIKSKEFLDQLRAVSVWRRTVLLGVSKSLIK